MRKICLLIVLLLIAKISLGESLILEKQSQLRNWSVRSGHPRLLITPDNKQEIVKRVENYYRNDFQEILDEADKNFGGSFEEWGVTEIKEYDSGDKLRDMIERCAFIYQMGDLTGFDYHNRTSRDYGVEGVRALLAMQPEKDWNIWNTISQNRVRMRYTGFALGYDWLYDLLTNEQKNAVISRMMKNNHFAFYPDDYSPSDKTGIGNFPRCKEHISGFAFMNDGIRDDDARIVIEQLYTGKKSNGQPTGLLSGGALDSLRLICGDGITIDGMLYMTMHKGYIPFLESWYTATKQDYFEITEFYKNLPLWIAYSLQPGTDDSLFRVQDMRSPFRMGDNYNKWDAGSLFSGLVGPLSRSDLQMARLSKWISKKLLNGYVYEPLIYKIIMGGDPQLSPASPKQLALPLNKRFEKHGWVSMRSDWEDPDATLATFMCHTYQFSRIGRFSNSFTIWKNKGPLLSNRGWGDHDMAFGDYTDSWNSFLFINKSLSRYDTNGRQEQLGGEEYVDANNFLPDKDDRYFKTGGIKYFETKPGKYNYVCGDASKAYLYNWRRPYLDDDRVLDLFTRQFVYFCGDNSSSPESDFFVIFDRVKTKHKKTEKHMLLQMSYAPTVIGDNWNIEQQINGEEIAGGKWKYNNPRYFIITNTGYNNAHGRAFVKTLLPENTVVYKIGGPGHQFNDWYGNDPSRSKSGMSYREPLTDEQKFYWGEYRLHILPAEKQKEDIFLHTIEATDISHTTPVSMEKISGNSVVGARVGQYIALFNTRGEFLLNEQAFFPYKGQFNVLITDLEPQRQYCITLGTATSTLEASKAGCIFLDSVVVNNSTLVIGTTALEPARIPSNMINKLSVPISTGKLKILFVFSLLLIGYVYIGYPFLLMLFSFIREKAVRKGEIYPSVTLLIAAYNEEKVIREKIENSLRIDYPRENLEIIVVSDGSDDKTDEIVQEYKDRGVILKRFGKRMGKTGVLNRAMKEIESEIVIFSDANTMYHEEVIKKLVRNFADPSVGAVTGDVRLASERVSFGQGERFYWQYERWIQKKESDLCSIIGVDGAMYAICRELYVPPSDNIILDDFVTSMNIAIRGHRVVYEPEALAFEETSSTWREEFRRRIRITAGAYQALWKGEGLPSISKGLLLFEYVSHRLLRWVLPFFLLALFVSNCFMLDTMGLRMFFGCQVIFYIVALIGLATRTRVRLFAVPFYFCLLNLGALIGFFAWLINGQQVMWKKER